MARDQFGACVVDFVSREPVCRNVNLPRTINAAAVFNSFFLRFVWPCQMANTIFIIFFFALFSRRYYEIFSFRSILAKCISTVTKVYERASSITQKMWPIWISIRFSSYTFCRRSYPALVLPHKHTLQNPLFCGRTKNEKIQIETETQQQPNH